MQVVDRSVSLRDAAQRSRGDIQSFSLDLNLGFPDGNTVSNKSVVENYRYDAGGWSGETQSWLNSCDLFWDTMPLPGGSIGIPVKVLRTLILDAGNKNDLLEKMCPEEKHLPTAGISGRVMKIPPMKSGTFRPVYYMHWSEICPMSGKLM